MLLCCAAFAQENIVWTDPIKAGAQVHGQGWSELNPTYVRLPEHARAKVRKQVWNLGRNSAGLSLVFRSNAPEIIVRYGVSGAKEMFHMPSTGVSGVDMYATDIQGVRRWCAPKFTPSFRDTITYDYNNLTYFPRKTNDYEYHLYLPLYNTVKWLEIGIPEGSELSFCPVSHEKPIVVYGTSIAQGACASRPGMAWTGIIERELEHPVVNLGFSGNGKLEPEVFELLSEIDAKLYIIDCMPNMKEEDHIEKLLLNGISILRSKHSCPILIVEHSGYVNEVTNESRSYYRNLNSRLSGAFLAAQGAGHRDLYYLTCDEIGLGQDGMVEGVHPNDLGMFRYAQAYEKKIREILHEDFTSFAPRTQDRDWYDWKTRHEEVLALCPATKPQVVLIGDSILHNWSGEPSSDVHRGDDSWAEYWSGRRTVNLGFGWDRIENILWRLTHGELDGYEAEEIYLMAGTNNLSIKATPEQIAAGVCDIIRTVRLHQPKARIHVCGLLPRGDGNFDTFAASDAILAALRGDQDFAAEMTAGTVTFTDMSPLMTGEDRKIIRGLYVDGLHPNAGGYWKLGEMMTQGHTR